jgi:hypothetical protein
LSLAFNSINADVLARTRHALIDTGKAGLTVRALSSGLDAGPTVGALGTTCAATAPPPWPRATGCAWPMAAFSNTPARQPR